MKCASVGVTLGQSLLKTLRFTPGSRSRSRFDKFQSTAVVPDFPPASLHLRCSFPRLSEVSFVDSFFWGEGEVNLIGIDCECIILIMIFFFMFQIFREIEKKKFIGN